MFKPTVWVGEHPFKRRRHTVRSAGEQRRENAGISSERKVRILPAENLRIPEEGSSAQGKPGPKVRPRGVTDGQLVENPVPPRTVMSEGVTQEGRLSG